MTRTPCMTEPQMWDLDQATYDDLLEAQDACDFCVLRDACRTEVEGAPKPPRSQWRAGLGFDEQAKPLSRAAALKFVAGRRKLPVPAAA